MRHSNNCCLMPSCSEADLSPICSKALSPCSGFGLPYIRRSGLPRSVVWYCLTEEESSQGFVLEPQACHFLGQILKATLPSCSLTQQLCLVIGSGTATAHTTWCQERCLTYGRWYLACLAETCKLFFSRKNKSIS